MSKQDNYIWAWKAVAVVFYIGLIIGLGFLIFQAIKEFYQVHTAWFWIIVIFIILGVVYYFTRDYANSFVRRLFTPKPNSPPDIVKPNITSKSGKQSDK